jgi:aldose 1-epimerase
MLWGGMNVTQFGALPDGARVERILIGLGDLEATILTYGAVIQDLRVAGQPVVLGLATLADYVAHSSYFGAVVGRCANRIAGGSFTLDGETFHLELNEKGRTHLHGGPGGFDKCVWALADAGPDFAELKLERPDGDQGYPGAVVVFCRYELHADRRMRIVLRGEADRPTLLNLATHSYFNLDGGGDVRDHGLRVDADTYLPVDADGLPTGEQRPVRGTPFDFRRMRRIGDATMIDHNFCITDAPLCDPRLVARLEAASGGLALEVSSTEPGLQVYDGAKIAVPVAGPHGRRYGAYAGLCLEPQRWPDAVHHPGFAGAVLRPGETYRQITDYAFPPAR